MSVDSKEMIELLIAAEDEIVSTLTRQDDIVVGDANGDLTLGIENIYTMKFGEYLQRRGIHTTLISEGRVLRDFEGENNFLTFMDPDEGSTNFKSGRLPYGANLIVFPDKPGDVRVRDWAAALVTDRKNLIKHAAYIEDGKGKAFVIDNGTRRSPNIHGKCPIIEIPAGYTIRDSSFFNQMAYYLALKDALADNQYRSVDATGTELVSVADGSTRVYVEGRELDKLGGAWNTIPSIVIINVAGGGATHLDGSEYWYDIVWNREQFGETGGYNPDVGRDVLATCDSTDYQTYLKALKPVIGNEAQYLSMRLKNAYD